MTTDPEDGRDAWLLTPGPLTTAAATKRAMLHDWGSRDQAFIEMNARVRRRLLAVADAGDSHVCVPLQGSGTFIVEATLGTLIPKHGKALVLINGAYGHRMAKIVGVMGRACETMEWAEDQPVDASALDERLGGDSAITDVAVVHCETTSGILNPIAEIADVVAQHRRRLILDSMSAYGALPLNAREVSVDAVMASSNKCLEGVPGMGFALIRRTALEASRGNAHSLALDLFDQWKAMEGNGQWRFTPPTHVLAAFDAALDAFDAEGGQPGRHARYAENCRTLVDGMAALGFEPLLPASLQAPIIVTFRMPADTAFTFETFYERLKTRGYVIYPGKLTEAPSFRIGCIGALDRSVIENALDAIREVIGEMGVASGAPAKAA